MACDLSLGRNEECKDNVGGIKAVYFMNYASNLPNEVSFEGNSVIDGFDNNYNIYKYELKGANSYEEENVKGNSTSSYNQTGTMFLKKQNATTLKELKMLSYGRPHAFIEDKNGNLRLAGFERGLDVQINNSTGASLEEDNGYSITFSGQERSPAHFVTSGGFADLTIVDN